MDIRALLIRHEGLRLKPYRDTVGKLTIGVGHNLDDNGITQDIAYRILDDDIANAERDLDMREPWWRSLDPVRRMVFVDMCFNLGINRFCAFAKMLQAAQVGDWGGAAREMHNSVWAKQVGSRAVTLANMMLTGVAPK